MTDNDKKPMGAKDLTAFVFGVAFTRELPLKTRKKLINAVFEAELGIKDLLPEEDE